jgi:outer membrane protein assembly factor BamB
MRAVGRAPAGVVAAGVILAATLGCARSPFQRAGNPADVAAALARSRPPSGKPANAAGQNLAFLVLEGTGGPRLGAYDLGASRLLWTQPAQVTTRIAVGATVFVHGTQPAGADAAASAIVTARDIGTGAVLWQHVLGAKERLYGYDLAGDVAFLVLQATGGRSSATAGDVLALEGRTGLVKWRHALPPGRVGAPAARGGLLAVPVQSQYVVLLDQATGEELAQVLSTEEAASFVRALPEGMFYGSSGIFLLGPETARGSRQSPSYLRAQLPAFVRPIYWYDHYRPEQSVYSAVDRNRILWRVAVDGDRARFRDDLAFVHHYRFFFGFDAQSGELRWAYDHPVSDAIASAHTGRALLFVTRDGEFGTLDTATGARTYEARLPGSEVVRGATFDAEGFAPQPKTAAKPDELKPGELLGALATIVGDPDQRFPELKAFAIAELGRLPGQAVTSELLGLLDKEGLPAMAYQKAGEALVGRRDADSMELLSAALKKHADYADGRAAPPVGLLARAVAALGPSGRAVAPELAAHLRLPETQPAAAAEIARALAAVGPDAAAVTVPALRDFLTLYRADPLYDADPTALIAAAEALLRVGGTAERELLLFIAAEPHTATGLRAHLRRALGETGAGRRAPESSAAATSGAE